MPWSDYPLRTLTIPANAGPNDPRTVIGIDIPAALQNWVGATFSQHCYYAQLDYDVTGGYIFAAFCYSDAIQISQQINGYMEANGTPHLFGTQGWNIPGVTGQTTFGYPGVTALPLDIYTAMTIDGISAPRASVVWGAIVAATAFTGAVGTEMAVLTTNVGAFRAGRAYRLEIEADLEPDTAGNNASLFLHRTNSIAGALVRFALGASLGAAGFGVTATGSATVRNNTGATINEQFTLGVKSEVVGKVRVQGGANRLAFVRGFDIGAAADFPNATAL